MPPIPLSTELVDLATGSHYTIVENTSRLAATGPPTDDVLNALNAVGLTEGWVGFWQFGSVMMVLFLLVGVILNGYQMSKTLSIEEAEIELEIRIVISRRKKASKHEIAKEALETVGITDA